MCKNEFKVILMHFDGFLWILWNIKGFEGNLRILRILRVLGDFKRI